MNLSAESRSVVESVEMALLDTCLEACSMLECASRSNQLVRIAMHYIEDHYSEKLSLDEIAKQIHISPVYLSNLFTKETGQSITQYIQIQRIEHAKTMLANSMDSIDCISEGVGYSNTKYFIKVFKRMTGITPAAYRSQAAVPPRHAK